MLMRVMVAASVGLLAGCATIFSGTSQDVTFTSEPEAAEVLIDGDSIGSTPLTVEIDRDTFKSNYVLLRKAGYRSEEFKLKKTLNTTALINCTSILSWGTDALTGAMMEYSPDKYFIELSQSKARSKSVAHRWALQYVLVNHRSLTIAIARGEGESLRALAALFAVAPADYPVFAAELAAHAPELVAYEHPHQLFRALRRVLEPRGFHPHDAAHLRFENTFELMPRVPATEAELPGVLGGLTLDVSTDR